VGPAGVRLRTAVAGSRVVSFTFMGHSHDDDSGDCGHDHHEHGHDHDHDVHHVHVWGLDTKDVALTAHVVLATDRTDNSLLHAIQHELDEQFHINHATIQFESAGEPACADRQCG